MFLSPRSSRAMRAGLLVCAAALSACGEQGGDPLTPEPVPPAGPAELAQLKCTANVQAGRVSCDGAPSTGGASGLIVGGQNVYVNVISSQVPATPFYDPGTQTFTFNVAVQNLIPQPLGTTDGATPSASGVRIIFHQAPAAVTGSGAIAISNADGTGDFTGSGQPYYLYSGAQLGADGILAKDETSSNKQWTFSVPSTVTTFDFTLYVVADVQYPDGWVELASRGDTLLAGDNLPLNPVVKTAVGSVVPGAAVTWGTTDAAVAMVDASGVVSAVGPGTATLTATSGTRTGSLTVLVCPNLAVGGVYTALMPAAGALCVGGGGAGAEFMVAPVNFSTNTNLALTATATGVVAAAGPPSPAVSPFGAPRLSLSGRAPAPVREPDVAIESALRDRERSELGPIIKGGRGLVRREEGARLAITAGVPTVGQLMTLNTRTSSGCGTPTNRTGMVKVVGTHVIVIADTANPSGGLTDADYQAIASRFDTEVYPLLTGVFGTPTDIDGNGRVIAFYTEAVNLLSTPGSGSYIGGFVYARDLFSVGSCAGSNQGEMFYMLAADPTGENGNTFSADFVKGVTLGTLGHEFQHLLNASRKLYYYAAAALEPKWLDEGLSHISEELIFYQNAGISPRQNITLFGAGAGGLDTSAELAAWNEFSSSNFSRMRRFIERPDTSGAFETDDDLATRGAIWAFLRYAADRRGGSENTLWNELVNTADVGMPNLAARLGTDPFPWFRDWVASMYADDIVSGLGTDNQNQSWNYRSFWAGSGTLGASYPVGTRSLGDGGEVFTLQPGASAAYLRFGVGAGGFGHVNFSSVSAPFSLMQVSVIRTK